MSYAQISVAGSTLFPVLNIGDTCWDCGCCLLENDRKGYCELRGVNVSTSKEACASFIMRTVRRLSMGRS